MTNETKIKNFKMTERYGYRSAPTHISDTWCPAKFESEISGNINLEKLVEDLKLKIIELSKHPNKGWSDAVFREPFGPHGITSDRADCFVSNALYDNENNLAAFILVNNRSWYQTRGSRSTWQRGIYGIKINENKLKGILIDFHRGHNYAEDDHFDENNNFNLDKLENGILKYRHFTKYYPIFKYSPKENKRFLNSIVKENDTQKCWSIEYDLKQV